MRDRVSQAEINAFANAAMELWRETGYPYVSMHEAVSHVWTQGNEVIKLPRTATAGYYHKIPAVRKHLIVDKGCMVAPVVEDYRRKVKRQVFAEADAAECLPSKGAPQAGFLFIDAASSDKDLMIWGVWLESERKVSTARGSEALESMFNAKRQGLPAVLHERQQLGQIEQLVLALEAGDSAVSA